MSVKRVWFYIEKCLILGRRVAHIECIVYKDNHVLNSTLPNYQMKLGFIKNSKKALN